MIPSEVKDTLRNSLICEKNVIENTIFKMGADDKLLSGLKDIREAREWLEQQEVKP